MFGVSPVRHKKKAHVYIDHHKLAGHLEGLEFFYLFFLVLLKRYGPNTPALFRHNSYSFSISAEARCDIFLSAEPDAERTSCDCAR